MLNVYGYIKIIIIVIIKIIQFYLLTGEKEESCLRTSYEENLKSHDLNQSFCQISGEYDT